MVGKCLPPNEEEDDEEGEDAGDQLLGMGQDQAETAAGLTPFLCGQDGQCVQ